MRLEWIEDILAVLRTGSLNRAAEQRHLSQPAFSRRLRSIEEYIGVELLDRSRKPVQVRPAVVEQRQRLEQVAARIRDLLHDLRQHEQRGIDRLVIASQHAITTTTGPALVEALTAEMGVNVHLRSANRDECFSLLVRRQADVMIAYQSREERLKQQEQFLDYGDLGQEDLIPVFAANARRMLDEHARNGDLPLIVYPPDVFFGELMDHEILPRLRPQFFLRTKAETALTLAALQLAIAGIGVAWIPESLAARELRAGSLVAVGDWLPRTRLSMQAIRLTGPRSDSEQQVWNILQRCRR